MKRRSFLKGLLAVPFIAKAVAMDAAGPRLVVHNAAQNPELARENIGEYHRLLSESHRKFMAEGDMNAPIFALPESPDSR